MRTVTQADIDHLNHQLSLISSLANRASNDRCSSEDRLAFASEIVDVADALELVWR